MADQWYYTSEGKPMDPVTFEQLKKLAERGLLKPADLVWCEGWPKWEKAGHHRELFSSEAIASDPKPARPKVAAPPPETDDSEWYERKPRMDKSPGEEDDAGDEYADRTRRRRKKSNAGVVWAIVGGLVGLGVLVGGVILAINLLSPGNIRSWNLTKNERKSFFYRFTQGKKVEIWVRSQQDSDVDLFVYPPGAPQQKFIRMGNNDMPINHLAFDIGDSKDCYVSFVAPSSGSYEVIVWNRIRAEGFLQHRNRNNNGTVEGKESENAGGLAANPPVNPPVVNPPIINPPPINPPIINPPVIKPGVNNRPPAVITLLPKSGLSVYPGTLTQNDGQDPAKPGCFCKQYILLMKKENTYTITMESPTMDSYLRLADFTGKQLMVDDDGAGNLNSLLQFQPQQTSHYKIFATTLGPGVTGNYTLKIQEGK